MVSSFQNLQKGMRENQMSHPLSISAVLPAYNEEGAIEGVVRAVTAALLTEGVGEAEIVLVDDGCLDETVPLALKAARQLPIPLRIVTHSENQGYGAALRSGFEAAKMDSIGLLDSDGQFDPADLTLLLAAYDSHTAVYAHRKTRADNLARKLNHAAFFALVRLLFGPTVRDVNCAFKLFPKELGIGLHSKGAVISTELVLRTRRSGYRVADVGVSHYPRTTGLATGAKLSVIIFSFVELMRLWRRKGFLVMAKVEEPLVRREATTSTLQA